MLMFITYYTLHISIRTDDHQVVIYEYMRCVITELPSKNWFTFLQIDFVINKILSLELIMTECRICLYVGLTRRLIKNLIFY
jgi:hypothetical protein